MGDQTEEKKKANTLAIVSIILGSVGATFSALYMSNDLPECVDEFANLIITFTDKYGDDYGIVAEFIYITLFAGLPGIAGLIAGTRSMKIMRRNQPGAVFITSLGLFVSSIPVLFMIFMLIYVFFIMN